MGRGVVSCEEEGKEEEGRNGFVVELYEFLVGFVFFCFFVLLFFCYGSFGGEGRGYIGIVLG